MKAMGRRLDALESRAGNPLDDLSDEELAARIAELTSALENGGIFLPPNFDAMPWPKQQAWFQELYRELAA